MFSGHTPAGPAQQPVKAYWSDFAGGPFYIRTLIAGDHRVTPKHYQKLGQHLMGGYTHASIPGRTNLMHTSLPQMWEGDGGAPGGGNQDPNPGGKPNTDPNPPAAPAYTPEQQAHLNNLLKQEREKTEAATEARVKQKLADDAAADAETKETERLAKQQEWETLSKTQGTKIEGLTKDVQSLTDANSRLATMGQKSLQSRLAEWPDDIKNGFPFDPAKHKTGAEALAAALEAGSASDVLAIHAWVETMAPVVDNYVLKPGTQRPGGGGNINPQTKGSQKVAAQAPQSRNKF